MTKARRSSLRRAVSVSPYLMLALGASLALTYAHFGAGGWDALYLHRLARSTGWCAVIALLLSLSCSPAHRLLRTSRMAPRVRKSALVATLVPLRRALGMTAALFALAHASIGLFGPLRGALLPLVTWTYLRAGLIAFAILTPLLATSFPRVNRALRVREFKRLHRLVYAALLFLLVHLAFGPFTAAWALLTVTAVSALLLALRLHKPRT